MKGSQFTGKAFTGCGRAMKIRISMNGRGLALDNIMVERFWRTIKYDDIYTCGYETMGELRRGIAALVENCKGRNHQTLGMSLEQKYRRGLEQKEAA